jgi:hypothetical protein
VTYGWNSFPMSIPTTVLCGEYGRLVVARASSISQWKKQTKLKLTGMAVVYLSRSAGVPTGDESVCSGDSGGPLVNEEEVLVGITSFGKVRTCRVSPNSRRPRQCILQSALSNSLY